MTRIKYNEISGILYTDWFTIGPNKIIRGSINLDNNSYEIREFDNNLIIEGTSSNLRKSKHQIKKLLQECGVNFTGEIRRR